MSQKKYFSRQAPVDAAFSVLREIYQNQGDNEPINMQTAVQRWTHLFIVALKILKHKKLHVESANGSPNCVQRGQIWYHDIFRDLTNISNISDSLNLPSWFYLFFSDVPEKA